MEIPERLQRFPLWKGRFPIFFTVSKHPDGSPNFRLVSREKQVEAINRNLCHVCVQKLTAGVYWFIVYESEMEDRETLDGPMHEECVRYACATCPFLVNPYHMRKNYPQLGSTNGRERVALCSTGSYRGEHKHRQRPVFRAGPWLSTDWTAVPQPEKISEIPAVSG